jgi:hypothetical protein
MRGQFFAFLLLLGSPFGRSEPGCGSWLNLPDVDLVNLERAEMTCTWSEPCQTIFSYELNDKNKDDHIDIKVTDGEDCGFYGDIKYYDDHFVNDINTYAVYDQTMDYQFADDFCITFTCDNEKQGCDKLDINLKMSCVPEQPPPPPPPVETQLNAFAENTSSVTKKFTFTRCISFSVTSDQNMPLVMVLYQ